LLELGAGFAGGRGFMRKGEVGTWEFGEAGMYIPGARGPVMPARRYGQVVPRERKVRRKLGILSTRISGTSGPLVNTRRQFKETYYA